MEANGNTTTTVLQNNFASTFISATVVIVATTATTRCGPCGGQVVSMLAFYSDHQSLNPPDACYSFFAKFVFEKNENEQKRPIFHKNDKKVL